MGSKRADDQKTEALCLVKKSWAVSEEGGEFFSGRCVRCACSYIAEPEILLNVKFFSDFVIAVRPGLTVIGHLHVGLGCARRLIGQVLG